jgi:hypothetical protein
MTPTTTLLSSHRWPATAAGGPPPARWQEGRGGPGRSREHERKVLPG